MIIYKYIIPVETQHCVLAIPEGATILHVESVNDQVCMWMCVDPNAPLVDRGIGVMTTGAELPDTVAKGTFIGTAVTLSGRVVYHLFDLGPMV